VGDLDRYKGLLEKQNESIQQGGIIQLAEIAPGVCWEIEEAFDTVYIGRREGNRRPLLEMCFLSLSYYPARALLAHYFPCLYFAGY